MTVQQILDMIEMYFPSHGFTNTQVLNVINEIQRQIFRELQIEVRYEFKTIADQERYALPSNTSIEFITYLGITSATSITSTTYFQEYTYCSPNDELSGYKYYDAFDGLIGIYPTPSETSAIDNVRLYYYKRPTLLSSSDLTATPDLNADWHLILVYDALIELFGAGHVPDIAQVNNYTIKSNSLKKEIEQSRYERLPNYPSCKDVMKRRRTGKSSDSEVIVINAN